MTRQIHVERVLDEWLAEGPSELPDRVIDGIVRQLEQTEQRRPGWASGRYLMNRMMLAAGGVAATLVVAVVAVGLYAGGAGPGQPPPSASPAGVLYESERHGYSLLLPDEGWGVFESSGEWSLGSMFSETGPGVDVVSEVGEVSSTLHLSSQRVPETMDFERWAADYDALADQEFPHCSRTGDFETDTVDGRTARIGHFVCTLGRGTQDTWVDAVWMADGRVYALRILMPASATKADAREEIDTWLGRLQLTD